MELTIGRARIEVVQGDITREQVDAIVNAANNTMMGGGGVDGAIHRAGGPAIAAECRRLGGCETGSAKITTAGNLPAKYVIHTVGPIYRDGHQGEPEKLANCYRTSITLAREKNARTIAFPAISCGVYGYPIPEAARIAVETVAEELRNGDGIDLVRFVMFTGETYEAFKQALAAPPLQA
ncbi:MAG: O-acetyl-ADP-ribose deacetylase [FCB group bacterium]|jgi:O-acetyl-ADP-ribose deacetylase (regulator of RNase III)|nr:O-acetyl-ADP-ribose deacetylase [FCB group bacterium]